ncbi:MAG: PhoH family protein, partial [Thermoplasmatales archaeon]|nr:PhoH family protein [Thermoplasmatales archaeon]
MKMISALRPYFARDNPNDIAWIGDYAKIFNEIGEIEKIMDEGEYLRRILNAEMKLYSLVQHKYQEVFPVVSEYVGSEVYPSLFPDSYDISEMSNDEINSLIEKLIDEMNEETSQKLHNFVVNAIKRDIYNNKNDIIFFIGPPGSGKSYGALSLASSVDPTFNVDRVVFSVEEFMDVFMKEETDPKTGEKIQKFLPKGSAIVFDDAGVDINAREWQTQQAKIMGKLSQS